MASVNHPGDGFANDFNFELSVSHNILFKLYASLLTNPMIQNGLQQITRLTQPLVGKFDDRVHKLTNSVGRWVSNKNVYNQLVHLWLSRHFPFDGKTLSFEEFAREFEASAGSEFRAENDFILKNFYLFANKIWKALEAPNVNDIRNALLSIAAKTINKSYQFQDETFADALDNTIKMLVEKRKELVSGESFFNLVKINFGDEFWLSNTQAIKNASNEFYVFAKSFLLIEFPLAVNNKDVLGLIRNYLQESSYYYGDITLSFVERRLDSFLRFFSLSNGDDVEDVRLYEKGQRILNKIFLLSFYPGRRVHEGLQNLQKTQAYMTLDGYLHINRNIDRVFALVNWSYGTVKLRIVEPSVDLVKFTVDKVRSTITIIIQGLDVDALRQKYKHLRRQYDILQKCVVMIVADTVHLVFDRKALFELGKAGQTEINRVYKELRTLELKKIEHIGMEYYSSLVKKANAVYDKARRDVNVKNAEFAKRNELDEPLIGEKKYEDLEHEDH